MPGANEPVSPAPAVPGSAAARGSALGALVPLAAVLAVVAIGAALAQVVSLERASVPKPDFQKLVLPGYPDRLSLKDAAAVAEAGMWWLSLTVLLWVTAAGAIGGCLWHLGRAWADQRPGGRRVVALFVAGHLLLATVVAAQAANSGTPMVPFIPMVRNLARIGTGFVEMANLNGLLLYLAGAVFVTANCVLLLPGSHGGAPVARIRALTSIMVGSAIFLAVWIATSTALYRLCAVLLVEEARQAALALAPTISLMTGLFSSLLVATGYLASALWLQHLHERSVSAGALTAEAGAASPIAFVVEGWPKVAGILMPLIPGAASAVLQAIGKAPAPWG